MDQAGIIRDLLIWLEGHLDYSVHFSVKKGRGKLNFFKIFF